MGAYPREGDVFGRYRIVRRIGRGGMSAVFEARQPTFDRSVALKVLSPDLSEEPEFRARFASEASMLATLESPHVTQVYEHGQHEGQLFIAMQLVRGRDLAQLIEESGPMQPAEALDLVSQAAMGLADAHRAGLLHRDVKPANILVRETEGDVFAYLCDFGIARDGAGFHTRTSGLMGTAGYMAPERHEGADASVATDIYSLGCVLWAALTGQPPYGRTSDVQVALAHMQAPVPVFEGETVARGQLNEILQRSMAKDPTHRYGSAQEMRRALLDTHLAAQGLRTTRHRRHSSAPATTCPRRDGHSTAAATRRPAGGEDSSPFRSLARFGAGSRRNDGCGRHGCRWGAPAQQVRAGAERPGEDRVRAGQGNIKHKAIRHRQAEKGATQSEGRNADCAPDARAAVGNPCERAEPHHSARARPPDSLQDLLGRQEGVRRDRLFNPGGMGWHACRLPVHGQQVPCGEHEHPGKVEVYTCSTRPISFATRGGTPPPTEPPTSTRPTTCR